MRSLDNHGATRPHRSPSAGITRIRFDGRRTRQNGSALSAWSVQAPVLLASPSRSATTPSRSRLERGADLNDDLVLGGPAEIVEAGPGLAGRVTLPLACDARRTASASTRGVTSEAPLVRRSSDNSDIRVVDVR